MSENINREIYTELQIVFMIWMQKYIVFWDLLLDVRLPETVIRRSVR